MKLSELSKQFEINLDDIETIILEQEGHTNRVRLIPAPTNPLHFHPDQHFDETKYPYITIELKNGDILDCKIGLYRRSLCNNCPVIWGEHAL